MKWLLILAPVVIIGVVAGLGFTGVIQIPGLTPKKALKGASAMYAQKDGKPVVKKEETSKPPPIGTPAKKTPPKKALSKGPQKDIEQGADALAAVWDNIETPELLKIAAKWKDEDFARVLAHMNADKVAEILQTMAQTKPERASKLSQVIQDQGSIVKAEG
ncbi:MAG TPA: hypothetical protein VHE55_19310 [Fimbriimonadaceae bacterium]|nr:hypothetical protein [Fimbriimonadaceae bacterium]